MSASVLDFVRSQDPRFKDVPDDELTLFVGAHEPSLLKDKGFNEQFAGVVQKAAIDNPIKLTEQLTKTLAAGAPGSEMAQEQAQGERLSAGISAGIAGIETLQKVLAAGAEGSEMGRAQLQNERSQLASMEGLSPGQILAKSRMAGATAAGESGGVLLGKASQPLYKVIPEIKADTLQRLLAYTSNRPDIRMLQERAAHGDKEAFTQLQDRPDTVLTPEAKKLVHGAAGVEQSLANTANFFTSPIGLATLGLGSLPAGVQKLVGLAFTAQMASEAKPIAQELGTEMGKPEAERDYEKIAKLTTDAISTTGFTAMGGLHLIAGEIPRAQMATREFLYNRTLSRIRKLAPSTADALERSRATGQELPPEEPMAGATAPGTSGPLQPGDGPRAAPGGQFLERITGASYTHPKTGEVSTGEDHPEAAAKQGVQAALVPEHRHGPEYGFEVINPETSKVRIVSRDEAEAIARLNGQLLEEPKRGKLHSDEVDFYKEKGKPDAIQQKAGEVLRDVQQPAKPEEGAGQVPADQRSPEAGQGSGELPQKADAVESPAKKIGRIIETDQAGFAKHVESLGGETSVQADAHRTGAALTDRADLEKLRKANEQVRAQYETIQKQAKEELTKGDVDKGMSLMNDALQLMSGKGQWISEVIEGATGSADATKSKLIKADVGENYKAPFPESDAPKIAEAKANQAVTQEQKDQLRAELGLNPDQIEELLGASSLSADGSRLVIDFKKFDRIASAALEAKGIDISKSLTVDEEGVVSHESAVSAGIEEAHARAEEILNPDGGEGVAKLSAPPAAEPEFRSTRAINKDIREVKANIKANKALLKSYQKAKDQGATAAMQEKIMAAENKLTELEGELSRADKLPSKGGTIAQRQFARENELVGDDILKFINEESGRLMSWSAFKEKAKTMGREWFERNRSLYDDIRNTKLPIHHNLAIYGGTMTPDQVADAAFKAGKISEPDARALWAEIKQASKQRMGAKRGETAEAKALSLEERQTIWDEGTRQNAERTRIEIDPSLAMPGDVYVIDGQDVTVKSRDENTGNLTIDGGEKFGEMIVREIEPFHVDSIKNAAEMPVEGSSFEETSKEVKPAEVKPKTEAKPKVAVDLFGEPTEPTTTETAPEIPGLGADEERDLTKREQAEFHQLTLKDRAAREEGGPQLTTEETKRYQKLSALAGQKELLSEDNLASLKGRHARLAEKVKELIRVRDLAIKHAQESNHLQDRWIKAATEANAQIEAATAEMSRINLQLPVADREFNNPNPTKKPLWEGKALTGQKMRIWETSGSGSEMSPDYVVEFSGDPREVHTAEFIQGVTGKPVDELLKSEAAPVAGAEKPAVVESVPTGEKNKESDRANELLEQIKSDQGGTRSPNKTKLYQQLGAEVVPGIRLGDAEEAGRLYEMVKNGDATSAEFAKWVADAKASNRIAEPEAPEVKPEAPQKYRIGTNPQTYTLLERLPPSEIERENGEQPMRVKNDKTGREEIVMEEDIKPVRTLSKEERLAGKPKGDLDEELRAAGLDPSIFRSNKEKRSALKREREKGQGPGSPSITQGPDPKSQIEQLEGAMRRVRGRRVPLRQQIREAFALGERLSAARDFVSRGVAGLKSSGDYLIKKWSGYDQLDDLLRAKGELSAELESRGWRVRQFVATIAKNIPHKEDRAAIAKWVDAGGDLTALQDGFNQTPNQYKQAYQDAMNLSGDLLVAAHNIRNFFDARLQEAIDAGVLETGVEDYIHRLYEKDPTRADQIVSYVQSGILSNNPRLAKKRIFTHDWEAERIGMKVVQDFLPRITAYETSLSRAIAAREFIRKALDLTAPDGRPVIDVGGRGVPIENAAGVRESTLIRSSFRPGEDPADPLRNRRDYKTREYPALRKWKWVSEDPLGNPIVVQGDLMIHPKFAGRIDALLKPSAIRYAENPKARAVGRFVLGAGSVVKQTMLDFSGFHQVQIAIHGLEHRVAVPISDIDFSNPDVDGLLKGGVTIGGDYFPEQAAEGLVGQSLSRLIPVAGKVLHDYHTWLFQNLIPRIKMTMALEAFGRNQKAYASDLASGRMTMEDIYHLTAKQANAAFGGLNYTMLERSKTAQDIARIIALAPDFLEARTRFALQAFSRGGGDAKSKEYWKKGGPLFNNEQRAALLLGAMTMYTVARVMNYAINGQLHLEPENAFSVVYKNKAYGLRTVQGDILHALTKPLQFWMSRLNPVYGRTILEAASGRDYFGRKRSPAEQLWDFVSTAMPISLRSNSERARWESLLNGMGVTARRFSDMDTAFKMGQKWKDKHGVQMKGEFIYDADKDVLRGLKVALSNGDEGGAVKQIKTLTDSGKFTFSKLNDYFNRFQNMPFTGSQPNDRKFYDGLNADEKKTVDAARQHKRSMNELYRQARDKYRSTIKEPADEEE